MVVMSALLAACGSTTADPEGVTTAAEKQRALAKQDGEYSDGQKWGGWKYQGDRDTCFYRVGRKCYSKKDKACAAAGCKAPKACELEGAGPAMVVCK